MPSVALENLLGRSRNGFTGRSRELGEELLDEKLALLLGQRLELDRGRPHPPAAPTGTLLEELWSREADDEERSADPVGDVLDQLEQRLLRPVDVLEEEDERLHVGERHHHLARRPRDLLRAALPFERLEHAGRQTEHVRDRLLLAALAELRERLLQRVVVRDACGGLDHLRQRPVGDTLAVREASPAQDARALEAVDELACESALSDSRLPEDREEMGTPVANGARERVLEQLELGFASDQRGTWTGRSCGTVHRVHQAPGAQ